MKSARICAIALLIATSACTIDSTTAPRVSPHYSTPLVVERAIAADQDSVNEPLISALTDVAQRVIPSLTDHRAGHALTGPISEITAGIRSARLAHAHRALGEAQAVLDRADMSDPDIAVISLVLEHVAQALRSNPPVVTTEDSHHSGDQ